MSERGAMPRHCASITREQAANFYYGIRLLPHDKRAAGCARSMRSRGASTTSATAARPAEKMRRLAAEARQLTELELADRDPLER